MALKSASVDSRRGAADRLAMVYWIPVYKYVRLKWRLEGADAEDTTQGFFAKLVDKELLESFDPDKGRLRSYLRRCIDNFAIDENRRASAKRRTTSARRVDLEAAERHIKNAAPEENAEELFAREWRNQLVEIATRNLRAELERKNKSQHWIVFDRLYLNDAAPTHAELADELGITAVDVNNRLAYAKRTFRRLLTSLLRDSTLSEDEYAEEARALGISSEKRD